MSDANAHVKRLVEWLSRPESYAEQTDSVERVETHISWVFLTRRFAYKLKKPVRFEFLDFTSPDTRHAACQDEVRLNRRLAHDVYLGVQAVGRDGQGDFRWEPDEPLDWLVHMRRLDHRQALDYCIEHQTLTRSAVHQVAHRLAEFYAALPPLNMKTDQYLERLNAWVQHNREELMSARHQLPPSLVRPIHTAQLRLLKVRPDLFRRRVHDGRMVEGHGDLRPEHIYLASQPVVIDCIEFREDFRQLDAVDELSFLAMECRHLDAGWIGEEVLQQYARTTGDQFPAALPRFYGSYRACVRAKVLALRAVQQTGMQQQTTQRAARRYLELADQDAQKLGGPWLIVVRGLTGTGKSSVAQALAEAFDANLLQTDRVRRQLFGAPDQAVAYGQGIYDSHHRQQVYQQVLAAADHLLGQRLTVILDGTFLSRRWREEAVQTARQHGAPCVMIETTCPTRVAERRIVERAARPGGAYQSSPEVYRQQRRRQAPDPPGVETCRVDTRESLGSGLQHIYCHVAPLIPDASSTPGTAAMNR